MATYIPAYKGYVTDVPEIWFKRNDGKIFHYDQLTAASFNPQVNFTEVNAGWSLFPVAYLPGQSTMEMQCTSGQFSAELFSMANAVDFKDNTEYEVPCSITATGTESGKATLEKDLPSGARLTYNGEEITPTGKAIELTGIAKGDTVNLTYYEKVTGLKEAVITNQTSAVGELIAKWPVYASGDETDAAGVKGYVLMKVYRCRVTQMPGFDTSYKSAATNSVTFSAMDSKLDNEAAYSMAFYNKTKKA